jgi:hypothetical protein
MLKRLTTFFGSYSRFNSQRTNLSYKLLLAFYIPKAIVKLTILVRTNRVIVKFPASADLLSNFY